MTLVFLDFETTGLNPEKHSILEVAAVVYRPGSTRVTTPFEEVVAVSSDVLANADSGAMQMHEGSGLLSECQRRGVRLDEVENRLAVWLHTAMVPGYEEPIDLDDRLTLAGNSIHFDRGFMRRHMPIIDRLFHYRMLDVSSFYIAAQFFGAKFLEKNPVHRAMPDVRESIRHFEFYRDTLFQLAERTQALTEAVLGYYAVHDWVSEPGLLLRNNKMKAMLAACDNISK